MCDECSLTFMPISIAIRTLQSSRDRYRSTVRSKRISHHQTKQTPNVKSKRKKKNNHTAALRSNLNFKNEKIFKFKKKIKKNVLGLCVVVCRLVGAVQVFSRLLQGLSQGLCGRPVFQHCCDAAEGSVERFGETFRSAARTSVGGASAAFSCAEPDRSGELRARNRVFRRQSRKEQDAGGHRTVCVFPTGALCAAICRTHCLARISHVAFGNCSHSADNHPAQGLACDRKLCSGSVFRTISFWAHVCRDRQRNRAHHSRDTCRSQKQGIVLGRRHCRVVES